MKELKEYLQNFNIEYSENEPMSAHTTFKIGGAARIMVFPKNVSEIQNIVKLCRNNQIRVIAVGKGSNLLVSDSGLDACVICLGNNFSNVYMADGETVFAESGASLIKLCRFALENELSGLEFAYGIPGSCGGAAFMNAGAYGGEMKDVLIKCTHINKNGDEGELCKKDLDLSYRHSAYYDNNCIITGIFVK
ncbi:MAG: FAD-binding protein, partial [Clostridiales bacterium]|nr:FAD-binding protein [Clostridiales bacterium]